MRQRISVFSESVLNVFLFSTIHTYYTSEVCEAVYAFQLLACDCEICIQDGVDTHHFSLRRRIIFLASNYTQSAIPYRSYFESELNCMTLQPEELQVFESKSVTNMFRGGFKTPIKCSSHLAACSRLLVSMTTIPDDCRIFLTCSS